MDYLLKIMDNKKIKQDIYILTSRQITEIQVRKKSSETNQEWP